MEQHIGVLCMVLALGAGVQGSRQYRHITANNQCSLYHNGCQYDFVLKATNCQGGAEGVRNRWTRGLPILQEPQIPPQYPHQQQQQQQPLSSPEDDTTADRDPDVLEVIPMKKLDQLERRLLKMMEGLSVRSLRHIRQIKADLRQMTGTIDLLRMKTTRKGEPVECPPEFIGIGTWPSCYRFSTFNATWHEAREYCAAFGANLVSMDTLKEAYILDYLIKSNPAFKNPPGWWTSGNYIVRSRRWMWTTKHHLKPIDFSRWAPGEPDARSTMHCMLLDRDAGYMWHDGMCTDNNSFICEIELL